MVGIRLGDELENKLAILADSLKRPKSSLIREAIEAKLEEWEDLQMVLESYRDDGKLWTLDEMIDRYSAGADAVED